MILSRFLIATSAIGIAALPALSSSETAWSDFRSDVETACAALIDAPEDADRQVEVNPFGSDSYGAALVTLTYPDGGADRMICIYDKRAKTAELTAPFGPDG